MSALQCPHSPIGQLLTTPCCYSQSNIGEDLLLAGQDQPFRFPAAFTFVVRSFTVLDGIGKSLTPKFDISEISAPYARSLLLEDNPVLKRLQASSVGAAVFPALPVHNSAPHPKTKH